MYNSSRDMHMAPVMHTCTRVLLHCSSGDVYLCRLSSFPHAFMYFRISHGLSTQVANLVDSGDLFELLFGIALCMATNADVRASYAEASMVRRHMTRLAST